MSQSYDADVALERAAVTLLNAGVWAQAAALFAILAERKPSYTMAWYGLSNALLQHSIQHRDLECLKSAYRCALRSLREDAENLMAAELLDGMRQRTPLRDLGAGGLSPYADSAYVLTRGFLSQDRLFSALDGLPTWTERMQLVMFLGDQYDESFVPLLSHALGNDPNKDVRMAAMKRLRPWGAHPAVREACERVVASGTWAEIEPYFTMGLRGMRAEWANALVASL